MIGIIFSYAKSAVVFAVMFAVSVTGIVLSCLFTAETLSMVLRIVIFSVLMISGYCAAATYALKLLATEIDKIGERECDYEKLGKRLYKLSRRTLFGGVRASILIEYAQTQLDRGLYKDAMASVSDAIIAGGDGVKGAAAVQFSRIFYFLGDFEFFAKYYDKAVETLRKHLEAKSEAERVAANVKLVMLEAMNKSAAGDNAAAIKRLDDFDSSAYSPRSIKNISALKEHMEKLN